MKNLRVPHRQMAVMLDRWVQANFRTEGGKVGGWQALRAGGRWISQGKVARGRRAGLGRKTKTRVLDTSAKILQDTGALRGSFQSFYSQTRVGIGSDLKYSEAHHLGNKGRNLPKRQLLPNEGDRELARAAERIYVLHVQRSMAKL